jgi:hypothetical protein
LPRRRFDGETEDVGVIERKTVALAVGAVGLGPSAGFPFPGGDDFREREIARCLQRLLEPRRGKQGIVGDGDDAGARVAIDGAKGVKLLEEGGRDARLFVQDSPCRRVEAFIQVDETARKRPLPLGGGLRASHQQSPRRHRGADISTRST